VANQSLFIRIFAKDDASQNLAKVERGIERLGGPLGGLATDAIGLTGKWGNLTETMLELGVGGGVAGLVFAGITGIAAVIGSLREETKKADEAAQDLVQSLLKAAERRADPFGIKEFTALNEAAAKASRELAEAERGVDVLNRATGGLERKVDQLAVDKATLAVNEAERAILEKNAQVGEGILATKKREADAAKQSADAAERELAARLKISREGLNAARAALGLSATPTAPTAAQGAAFQAGLAETLRIGDPSRPRLFGLQPTLSSTITTGLNAPLSISGGGVAGSSATPASLAAEEAARIADESGKAAQSLREQMQAQFADAVGGALVDGIGDGFAALFATGSLGEGFKALTNSLLSGLGSAMVAFGKQSLFAALSMDKIRKGLASFLPGGAITASIALIAAGSAISSLAGSAQSSFGGGGGGASASSFSSSTAAISAETAAPIVYQVPRELGSSPNDPAVHDWFAATMRNALKRDVIKEMV
jgi:hypothetical protein